MHATIKNQKEKEEKKGKNNDQIPIRSAIFDVRVLARFLRDACSCLLSLDRKSHVCVQHSLHLSFLISHYRARCSIVSQIFLSFSTPSLTAIWTPSSRESTVLSFNPTLAARLFLSASCSL
jgi:hypothetical protein